MPLKVFAQNKKAGFDYEILEKFEAGLVLNGQEIKSIKVRGLNLAGTYIIARPEGFFWVGAKILAYQPANAGADYHEERSRKLLLHKVEMERLRDLISQKNLTFVPLRLYTNNRYEGSGKIKLEFGVGRGKKKYDKRESIKKRDTEREINRVLSKF